MAILQGASPGDSVDISKVSGISIGGVSVSEELSVVIPEGQHSGVDDYVSLLLMNCQ